MGDLKVFQTFSFNEDGTYSAVTDNHLLMRIDLAYAQWLAKTLTGAVKMALEGNPGHDEWFIFSLYGVVRDPSPEETEWVASEKKYDSDTKRPPVTSA